MNKLEINNIKKILWDWIIVIFIAITVGILIKKFIIFQVEIPSESMIHTLNVEDRLYATRIYNPEKLKRGDLIVFYFEPEDEMFIKRLIGFPNDEIVIKDGVVSVNGEILTEDYVENPDDFKGEYKVPDNKYFFLGDNRKNSLDSRYWENPYIDFKDIKGKAFFRIYPFNNIGIVE